MGKIDWSGAIGSSIQGLMNLGSTALANNAQRKCKESKNAFNAQQADLNRQFQSREAEIARDWQEQQYNEYSSPEAMVRQYKEAGLNPALMYGANLQSSTGSTSAPSGSAASGSTPSAFAADLTGIASAFLGLAKLKQDIKESQSRENANNAAAFASERAGLASNSQSAYHQSLTSLTKEQANKVREEFRLIAATATNEEYKKIFLNLKKRLKNYNVIKIWMRLLSIRNTVFILMIRCKLLFLKLLKRKDANLLIGLLLKCDKIYLTLLHRSLFLMIG